MLRSMARRDGDEEIDIEQRKKKLDSELKEELYGEIFPDWDGYEPFLLRAKQHLNKREITRCKKSVVDVFDALEDKGIISPGHYEALRELLVGLNEPAVVIIDNYLEQFDQLIRLKGKGKTKKRKEDVQESVPSKKVKCNDTENKELTGTIEVTSLLINEHASDATFIKTKSLESGEDIIKQDGRIVFFSGNSGTGKTKNALEILRWFRDEWDVNNEYKLVRLSSLCKWNDLVDAKTKMVVFLDNLLNEGTGNSVTEEIAHTISGYISTGNLIFIATLQNNDYSLNKRELEKHKLFHKDHIIDLSSENHKLSILEKTEILRSHLQKQNLKLSNPLEAQNIIKSDNEWHVFFEEQILENYAKSPVLSEGYPRICYLFCNEYFHIGYEFFLHPNKYIIEDYHSLSQSKDEIDNTKYCLLVLVMLYRRQIVNDLNIISEKVKDIAPKLSFKDQTLPRLSSAISSLLKHVLKSTYNSFLDFQDEYIYKAICISYGRYFPGEILKLCSSNFFYELIRTEYSSNESEKERMLIIPRSAFDNISCRFLEELSHGHLLEVCTHPIMRDEMFIGEFFATQQTNPIFMDVLVKRCMPYVLMFDGEFYTVDSFFNICCIYGYLALAKYLLEFVNFTQGLQFAEGFRLACARDQVEIAAAIVEKCDWPPINTIIGTCFDACSVGNMKTVQFLSTKYVSLFFKNDKEIRIPIVQAVKNKHKEIVKSLLQEKIKINAKCCKMIYEYCLMNDWQEICDFMKKNHKISFGQAEHQIYNIKATSENELDIRSASVRKAEKKILFSHKIKNKMNHQLGKKKGPSVIRFLAQNGMEFNLKQLVKSNFASLVESGMINEKDADGMTPLLLAADKKYLSIVKELLKINTVDINITANDGDTILHYCARYNWSDVARFLTKHKHFDSLLNIKGFNGQTPITVAASNSSEGVINILLKHQNIDITLQDDTGDTFLHKCAWNGLTAVFKKHLSQRNIDDNLSSLLAVKGKNGYTAIMCAAIRKHKVITEFLLKKMNAGTTVIDQDGNNLLFYCHLNSWIDLIGSVIKYLYIKRLSRNNVFNVNNIRSQIEILLNKRGYVLCFSFTEMQACVELSITSPTKTNVTLCRTEKGWNRAFDIILFACCIGDCVAMITMGSSNAILLKGVKTPQKIMEILLSPDIDKDINIEYSSLVYICVKEGFKDMCSAILKQVNHMLNDRPSLNVSDEIEFNILKLLAQKHQYLYDMLAEYDLINYPQNTTIGTLNEDVSNESILSKACENGIKEIVDELINDKELDVSYFDQDYNNLFQYCAKHGWFDILQHVLRSVPGISEKYQILNQTGCNGHTILLTACDNGQKEMIEELLKYDELDVTCTDKKGNNVLHYCASHDWIDTLLEILQKVTNSAIRGQMLNQKDYNERTIILKATEYGQREIVEALMKYKEVDMTCVDTIGDNILHNCVRHGWIDIIQHILKSILDSADRGQMLNQKGYDKQTVILKAAAYGHKKLVEELMKYKEVDMTCVDKNGDNILHYCVRCGSIDILQHILTTILDSADRGQMLNQKGYYERTVILKAADNGHKELVEELMKYKEVDITCFDKYGDNILHYCARQGWIDILQYILTTILDSAVRSQMLNQKGYDKQTVILKAVGNGHKKLVEELMKYKEVYMRCVDKNGDNILHYCVRGGWIVILQHILTTILDSADRGQMLNQKGYNEQTVILKAVGNGHKELVEELMKYKEVDMTCVDKDGDNILHYCARRGWIDILQHILTTILDSAVRGQMLNQKGYNKQTVILEAAYYGHKEVVEKLLKYKEADMICVDKRGNNLHHYCVKNGWTDMIQNLLCIPDKGEDEI